MRYGAVEVNLFESCLGAFFHERQVGGSSYFVAIPGSEYQIRVAMYDQAYLHPADAYLKLILRIDGQSVGYSGYFEPDELFRDYCEYNFTGYLRSSIGGMSKFYAFRFDTCESLQKNEKNTKVGIIDVWVYVCRPVQSNPEWSFTPSSASSADRSQRLSASTCLGREVGPLQSRSIQLDAEHCELLHHVQANYHTMAALNSLARKYAKRLNRSVLPLSTLPTAVSSSSHHTAALTKPAVKGVSLVRTEGGRIQKRQRNEESDVSNEDMVESVQKQHTVTV